MGPCGTQSELWQNENATAMSLTLPLLLVLLMLLLVARIRRSRSRSWIPCRVNFSCHGSCQKRMSAKRKHIQPLPAAAPVSVGKTYSSTPVLPYFLLAFVFFSRFSFLFCMCLCFLNCMQDLLRLKSFYVCCCQLLLAHSLARSLTDRRQWGAARSGQERNKEQRDRCDVHTCLSFNFLCHKTVVIATL